MDVLQVANAYAKFYEQLTSESSREEYGVFFDNSSEFADPFQKVQGLHAIHNIFIDMYTKLYKPHFIVDEVVASCDVAYIRWHFHYALSKNSKAESFTGVSRVTFSKSAKVKSHIDYWDAGENVYEKIPLLGTLLRFVKRKLHA